MKRKCPECGGRLEKLLSRTSFQLKGGGWFEHGYGSGADSGAGKAKAKSKAAKADKSGSKKDSGAKDLAAAGSAKG